MSQGEGCFSVSKVVDILHEFDGERQIANFRLVQTYVLFAIFLILFQLAHRVKPFAAYPTFLVVSWASYYLIPLFISNTLGIAGKTQDIDPRKLGIDFNQTTIDTFQYLACLWSILLLFAFAGFDNLNIFFLDEIKERSGLVAQFGIQLTLVLLIIYHLPANINVIPLSCGLIVLAFKFLGRFLAMAHAGGATPKINKEVTRIINYMNREDVDGETASAHPVTMAGSDYLVGPKYAKVEEDGRIVDGITMEKIWRSTGRLLGSNGNMELKDTCLSFSLFWLLLGKIWGYPLYDDHKSRSKAWRMVRHGLLSKKGGHERVFRVIEVELAFLNEYFHARYIFFYLNGFYWKLVTTVPLPVLFWWFIQKAVDQNELNKLNEKGYTNTNFTKTTNMIVLSVIVALEGIQILAFLTSRWFKVTLLCFYVKKMASEKTWCLSRFLLEVLGFVFLGSSRSSNSGWWRKTWKRELPQYSIFHLRAAPGKRISYQLAFFCVVSGGTVPTQLKSLEKPVKMSNPIKEAVVLCLQRSETSLKLSNGAESLRLNGVMEMLPDWACNLKDDVEAILVWHIATSVCDLHDLAVSRDAQSTNDNKKVATELSKYCAHLLFCAPYFLPVPSLESETICAAVVDLIMELFSTLDDSDDDSDEDTANSAKYEKLMDLISSEEEDGEEKRVSIILKRGVKLGDCLINMVGNEETRWKILADFWAEKILYLAPSNNRFHHAFQLTLGGEFITHIWALLIHAGICNRNDIEATFQQDGNA